MDSFKINYGNKNTGRNQPAEKGFTFGRTDTKGIPWISGRLLRRKGSTISWILTMGSQNRDEGYICAQIIQDVYLTPQEQIELDKFLKENLEKGYIRPSQSPMASPFFFVDKKDGKLRPCQDYWYLNEHTVKNAYPLPSLRNYWTSSKGLNDSPS